MLYNSRIKDMFGIDLQTDVNPPPPLPVATLVRQEQGSPFPPLSEVNPLEKWDRTFGAGPVGGEPEKKWYEKLSPDKVDAVVRVANGISPTIADRKLVKDEKLDSAVAEAKYDNENPPAGYPPALLKSYIRLLSGKENKLEQKKQSESESWRKEEIPDYYKEIIPEMVKSNQARFDTLMGNYEEQVKMRNRRVDEINRRNAEQEKYYKDVLKGKEWNPYQQTETNAFAEGAGKNPMTGTPMVGAVGILEQYPETKLPDELNYPTVPTLTTTEEYKTETQYQTPRGPEPKEKGRLLVSFIQPDGTLSPTKKDIRELNSDTQIEMLKGMKGATRAKVIDSLTEAYVEPETMLNGYKFNSVFGDRQYQKDIVSGFVQAADDYFEKFKTPGQGGDVGEVYNLLRPYMYWNKDKYDIDTKKLRTIRATRKEEDGSTTVLSSYAIADYYDPKNPEKLINPKRDPILMAKADAKAAGGDVEYVENDAAEGQVISAFKKISNNLLSRNGDGKGMIIDDPSYDNITKEQARKMFYLMMPYIILARKTKI